VRLSRPPVQFVSLAAATNAMESLTTVGGGRLAANHHVRGGASLSNVVYAQIDLLNLLLDVFSVSTF